MKIAIRHCLLPLLGLLALVLGGCSASPESGRSPVRATELLKVTDVEALRGAPVEQPPKESFQEKKEMDFWMTMVTYWAEQPGISLGLMVQPFAAGVDEAEAASAAYLRGLKASLPEYSAEVVAGIGSQALWDEQSGQLTVFHRQRMYLITIGGKGAQDKFNLAKKTALVVLAK